MIVVSNTTPLNYLVLIDAIDILAVLFGEVYAPSAVVSELNAPSTPMKIREWIASPPGWLRILEPAKIDSGLDLGAGEIGAIALAEQLKASLLLVDDRRARRVAEQRGLDAIGTLGVLVSAASKNLINMPELLGRLGTTSFRVSASLIQKTLKGHGN